MLHTYKNNPLKRRFHKTDFHFQGNEANNGLLKIVLPDSKRKCIPF
jgi:hypothetical protein